MNLIIHYWMWCNDILNWKKLIIQKWMNVTVVSIIHNWKEIIIQKWMNVTVVTNIHNWKKYAHAHSCMERPHVRPSERTAIDRKHKEKSLGSSKWK